MKNLLQIILVNLFIVLFLYTTQLYAKDYIFESGGINPKPDTIEYPDGTKFIVYPENNIAWKDSDGDYGSERCIGTVNVNKDKSANVYFRCESTNQIGEKFWTTRVRNSLVEDGGGGINTYVSGTGKYERLVGIKCPYGVKYHNDVVWYTHKCKIPD